MSLHELSPAPGSRKKKRRVGQGVGSGRGKTSGKGHKGQRARAGRQVRPGFEGGQMPIHMRLPKLRGFKNPFRVEYQVVNVDTLQEAFPNGGDVTVEDLVEKNLVRKGELVKILGTGEITVPLNIEADKWSASALEKVTKAGGSITAR